MLTKRWLCWSDFTHVQKLVHPQPQKKGLGISKALTVCSHAPTQLWCPHFRLPKCEIYKF